MMNEHDTKSFVGWHNYRTGKTDYLTDAPADYRDYISQDYAAQQVYKLRQELHGDTPQQAALHVLTLMCGEKPQA